MATGKKFLDVKSVIGKKVIIWWDDIEPPVEYEFLRLSTSGDFVEVIRKSGYSKYDGRGWKRVSGFDVDIDTGGFEVIEDGGKKK